MKYTQIYNNEKQQQDLQKARAFIRAVKMLAQKEGRNVFVVTDGASGILNNNSHAVKAARDAHIQWQLDNKQDPYQDWSATQ